MGTAPDLWKWTTIHELQLASDGHHAGGQDDVRRVESQFSKNYFKLLFCQLNSQFCLLLLAAACAYSQGRWRKPQGRRRRDQPGQSQQSREDTSAPYGCFTEEEKNLNAGVDHHRATSKGSNGFQ